MNNTNETDENQALLENSPLVGTKYTVCNYREGRTVDGEPRGVERITLHIMVGDMSPGGTYGTFDNPYNPVSATYGVYSNGEVAQFVDEKNTPFSDSDSRSGITSNPLTVSIEIANLPSQEIDGKKYDFPVTDDALDKVALLCADVAIRNKLGPLERKENLFWHSDFSGKSCPGDYIKEKTPYIMETANKLIDYYETTNVYPIKGSLEESLAFIESDTSYTAKESDSDASTVSVDYLFVKNYLNSMKNCVNGCNINSLSNISINTDGSATFAAAYNVFNNYSTMTSSFLSILDASYNSIASIADSMYRLDSELTDEARELEVNGYLTTLQNQNIGSILEFFDNTEFDSTKAFDISEKNGEIKLSKEGLLSALSDNSIIMGTLLHDITDTQNIKQSIDSFITDSSNTLNGDAWDKVRIKLDKYSDICEKKINYANSLFDSLKTSYQKLLDYLEEYEELDTSEIPEYTLALSDITTQITELEAEYNALSATNNTTYCEYNEDGEVINSYVIDNTALMNDVSELIAICNKIKEALEKKLEKLNGLLGVDTKSAQEIEEAENSKKQELENEIASAGQNTNGASSLPPLMPSNPAESADATIDNNNDQDNVAVSNDSGSAPSNEASSNDSGSAPSNEASSNNSDSAPSNEASSNNSGSAPNNTVVSNDNSSTPDNAIVTDDTKMVYNVDDECKLIIYHDGDNVTGMEYYYVINDQTNMDEVLNKIYSKYSNMEGYNGISINGREIKVLFSSEFCQQNSLSYYKEQYSNYQIVR